jgi:hypothetical protein
MSDDVKMVDILDVVSAHYGLSIVNLKSRRRTNELLEPRHVACYLAAKMTTQSTQDIADYFLRDRTTMMHSRDKIAHAIIVDRELNERVMALELAALAMSKLRQKNVVVREEPQTPLELARLICEHGARAACGISVSQIQELCEALIHVSEAAPPPPPPPLLPPPPDARDRIADLVARQSDFSDRPTLSNRKARDKALELVRDPELRRQTIIDEIVKAFADMNKAEFTKDEKYATQKFNDLLRCAENWLEQNSGETK